MSTLGEFAVSTMLIPQLICATVIDAFGIMGTEKLAFGWNKYFGAVIMFVEVLVFLKIVKL